jgi:DNA-directed RNA polymerase specialized sigma24 family protein
MVADAMNNMPHASLDDLLRQAAWVLQLAAALTLDSSSADDLAQDAMLTLLQTQPRSEGSAGSWLARVLRNLARSRWRADDRRKDRERS